MENAIDSQMSVKYAIVHVQELKSESINSSSASTLTTSSIQKDDKTADATKRKDRRPKQANAWSKLREGGRLSYTRCIVGWQDLTTNSIQPISVAGNFNHRYVYPLDNRKGKNERIFLQHWAPTISIRNGTGKKQMVVQAASHNYAGFYESTDVSEELHHMALQELPATDSCVNSALQTEAHAKIATFFRADFCYTTSTGYGSNLLAFTAILNKDWLVLMDEKSHNSMHVAAYMSHAGLVRKFGHNDMDQLEVLLCEYGDQYAHVLVAVEGFYSMDGDIPPLADLNRLKRQHAFALFADEAHSFLCLGHTGRGCVEFWNDSNPQAPVQLDLFDLRTGTMSKSVGSLGGFVCGKAEYGSLVQQRHSQLLESGSDPVSTSALVQTLYVLGQPTVVQCHLHRLKKAAVFVRHELHRAGIYVYGDAMSPILPIYTGRPSLAARFSYALRKAGLLATPISTPAVPFWEARVRVCLSSAHDDDTIDKLVASILKAADLVGICKASSHRPEYFHYGADFLDAQQGFELQQTKHQIVEVIKQDIASGRTTMHDMSVVDSGHDARKSYGLGSGGSRGVTGTSELHLDTENLVARLVGMPDAMTYADSYIGLISTIAALCRPVVGYKKHYFFIPENPAQAVLDGIRVAPKKGSPSVVHYSRVTSLIQQVRNVRKTGAYTTCYIRSGQTEDATALQASLGQLMTSRAQAGMTLLLHDEDGIHSFKSIAEQLTRNSASVEKNGNKNEPRVLVYGSFLSAFGLPGAYLTGDPTLLRELRYTSRGYMFTTAQQPFVMAMIAAEVNKLLKS